MNEVRYSTEPTNKHQLLEASLLIRTKTEETIGSALFDLPLTSSCYCTSR